MMIEACAFGTMTVAGRTYRSDLMILPDGQIIDHWRRQSGHRLCMADIQPMVAVQPVIIIAGTGIFGLMRPQSELEPMLGQHRIQLVALKTKIAANEFNRLKKAGEKVAGCFHLTC
jgi:hypothetical protein